MPRLRSVVPAGFSLAVVAPLVIAFGVQIGAQSRLTKQDADRCEGKLGLISRFAAAPKSGATAGKESPASQTTHLTDAEVNAYLRYNLKDQVPAGVVEPLHDGRRGAAGRRDETDARSRGVRGTEGRGTSRATERRAVSRAARALHD